MGVTTSAMRFPEPSGTYKVGCADMMVKGINVDPCGSEDFDKYTGIFVRIYYPRQEQEEATMEWVPRMEYVEAWSYVTKLPPSVFTFFHHRVVGPIPVPVMWQSKLVGTPPGDDGSKITFPVVVFSHGMLAMRSSYTAICSALASQGIVVIVLEHRDRSSMWSFRYLEDGSEKPILFQVHRKPEQKTDFEFRLAQVTKRAAECKAAFDLLKRLDSGDLDGLKMQVGSDFDWTQFKGRLNCDQAVIAGHSFGGATALVAAGRYPDSFKAVLVLDAWMKPVHKDLYSKITIPVLFLNSTQWEWAVEDQMKVVNNGCAAEKLILHVKNSTHQNFCDVAYMLNGTIGRTLRTTGKIDPWLCAEITDKLLLTFLEKHLGISSERRIDAILVEYDDWLDFAGASCCETE